MDLEKTIKKLIQEHGIEAVMLAIKPFENPPHNCPPGSHYDNVLKKCVLD